MRIDLFKVCLPVVALVMSMLTACAGPAAAPPASTATPVAAAGPSATPRLAPTAPPPTGTRPPVAASPARATPSPVATRPPATATSRATSTPGPAATATRPAGTQTAGPSVVPAIAITNLMPAPNSSVPSGMPVTIAANITSNVPVGAVTVLLDGNRIDVEGGGRSETQQAFFTSRLLEPGAHTVRAIVTGRGAGRAEANWSFTVGVSPTATPSPGR